MKHRIALLLFVCSFVATPVFAQGPGRVGGGPVGSLDTALAALTARVAKLEGNIVASDLAGTYNVAYLETTMDGIQPNVSPATITTKAFRGTLTLNANGTGSASAPPDACGGSTLTQGTWTLTGINCAEEPGEVTWTYANGVITITFSDGDQLPFAVALGGRLFVMAFAAFHPSDPSSNQVLFLATRLQ
jgi:hypothetical protein